MRDVRIAGDGSVPVSAGGRSATEPHFRVESHQSAAVLHVAGALTPAGAVRALRLCEQLPADVRELRVDLRAATYADTIPLQTIAMMLARWRRAQPARQSRIDLPPAGLRPVPTPPRARPKLGRRVPRCART